MTIYWLMFDSALMLGLWWWLLTPVTILVVLFVGLYLVSVGLDEIAKPAPARTGGGAGERPAGRGAQHRVRDRGGCDPGGGPDRLRRGSRLAVGIIGESGSGKTTTALALLGMIDPPGRVTGGKAMLDGVDLLTLSEAEMARVRLRRVAYIPQGAMNALNPVRRIADHIRDGMIDHGEALDGAERERRIAELLERVDLLPDTGRMFPA